MKCWGDGKKAYAVGGARGTRQEAGEEGLHVGVGKMEVERARGEGGMHGVGKIPSTGRGDEGGDCGESCGVEER